MAAGYGLPDRPIRRVPRSRLQQKDCAMAHSDIVPASARMTREAGGRASLLRLIAIGTIGFLTLVDLFAAQAILPTLVAHYGVKPAAMGFAVNASTMGMAFAGLAVSLISRRINRWRGIWLSLAVLALPTALLSAAPDLATFTALRIVQGLFMASAFTLTMAYLAEHLDAEETASALAAYVTGIVASNLVGRLVSAAVADHAGLAANFFVFAGLNLAGAALVYFSFERMSPMAAPQATRSPLASWAAHLGNPALLAAFGIGFCILFAFIGTFTYVNFVLAGVPISVGQMSLGFVYFVFLPSLITTPLAGRTALRHGVRPVFWLSMAVAGAGLPLLLVPSLAPVLAGMVLMAVGTFFAQAVATGFVSRTATRDRAAASGLYLASYYLGGLAGASLLGQLFERFGWVACVVGVGLSLAVAALLACALVSKPAGESPV